VDASCLLVKNTEANRGFVQTWLEYCTDDRILTDRPNECGRPDLPEFIAHRHDQAVLSVLAWRERDRFRHMLLRDRDLMGPYLIHHRRRSEHVPLVLVTGRRRLRRWRALWRARVRRGLVRVGRRFGALSKHDHTP
jgi:hypothetical protein